jgi:hypothetical protein
MQVQIFDPAVRVTPTGDCEIIFLYERIDQSFSPSVGIENPAETVGLQLQFNDEYGEHTWLIRNGSAVLFTTAGLGSVSGSVTGHPVPDSWAGAFVSAAEATAEVDEGGSYFLEGVRTGPQSVTVSFPGYETLSVTSDVAAGDTAEADFEIWRLDPPRDLIWMSAETWLQFEWLPPLSVGGQLDEFAEYAVYSNGELLATTEEESYGAEFEPGVYSVHVVAVFDGGPSEPSNSVEAESTTPVSPSGSLPQEFALSPAFPNPFNAETTIRFAVPHDSRVTLRMYDILGREATLLTDQIYSAGYHLVKWRADGLSSGLYFMLMTADDFQRTQKLMLLK